MLEGAVQSSVSPGNWELVLSAAGNTERRQQNIPSHSHQVTERTGKLEYIRIFLGLTVTK